MIRNAVPADLDAIAALHAEARASYYRGHIADELFDSPAEHARVRGGWEAAIGRGTVLCAERDGTVAGVAASREIDGVMHLTQLHVDPGHWRAGIGTELHAACVASWQRAGVTTARLKVFDTTPAFSTSTPARAGSRTRTNPVPATTWCCGWR